MNNKDMNNTFFIPVRWINIPSCITGIRCILTIPIIYYIIAQRWEKAFFLFFIAALTDGIDGYIARSMQQCTSFGAIFDAFADKLLIISVLCALTFTQEIAEILPFWFSVFIIVKELIQLMGGIGICYNYRVFEIKPLFWGKLTMLLYLMLIIYTLYGRAFGKETEIGHMGYVSIAFVSVLSFLQYCAVAYHFITMQQRNNCLYKDG